MKLLSWGKFGVYWNFEEDLDKLRTRRVEFQIFKYAVYFNFQTMAGCWEGIACIDAERGVEYLTTEGAKHRLDSLFKALTENENDEAIRKQIGDDETTE
jgi:hypothetical protein